MHPGLYGALFWILLTYFSWNITGVNETERRRRMTQHALDGLLVTTAIFSASVVADARSPEPPPLTLLNLIETIAMRQLVRSDPNIHPVLLVIFGFPWPVAALIMEVETRETSIHLGPRTIVLAALFDYVLIKIIGWFMGMLLEDRREE